MIHIYKLFKLNIKWNKIRRKTNINKIIYKLAKEITIDKNNYVSK